MANYSADVIIAGAGLAGLATAYDLLERGRKVLVLDKDSAEAVGGHDVGLGLDRGLGSLGVGALVTCAPLGDVQALTFGHFRQPCEERPGVDRGEHERDQSGPLDPNGGGESLAHVVHQRLLRLAAVLDLCRLAEDEDHFYLSVGGSFLPTKTIKPHCEANCNLFLEILRKNCYASECIKFRGRAWFVCLLGCMPTKYGAGLRRDLTYLP